MSLVVTRGRVIDPANATDGMQDVLIADGKIERVGARLPVPAGAEVVDAAGKIVCPGFIDIHVHLREPGHEYKETVATSTRSAPSRAASWARSWPSWRSSPRRAASPSRTTASA